MKNSWDFAGHVELKEWGHPPYLVGVITSCRLVVCAYLLLLAKRCGVKTPGIRDQDAGSPYVLISETLSSLSVDAQGLCVVQGHQEQNQRPECFCRYSSSSTVPITYYRISGHMGYDRHTVLIANYFHCARAAKSPSEFRSALVQWLMSEDKASDIVPSCPAQNQFGER